jgi:hypothetical protein
VVRQQSRLLRAVWGLARRLASEAASGMRVIAPVIDRLPAVLTAADGGSHQGTAITETPLGVITPGGNLPPTLPRPAVEPRRRCC